MRHSNPTIRRLRSLVAVLALGFLQTSPALAGDSQSVRAKTTLGLGLRLGTVISTLVGYGGDVFINLGPRLQVGVFAGKGSMDVKNILNDENPYSSVEVTSARLDGTLFLGQARLFLGNSFYIGGGIGQRKIDIDFGVRENTLDAAYSTQVLVTSNVIQAMIGNLWAWDSGFYIGADWIGYTMPTSSSYTTTTTISGIPSSELNDLQETSTDLAETIGEASSGQLLFLHLGIMF